MHRSQRGGASGIHRHARSAEIEAVGNPVSGDAMGAASGRVRADPGAVRCGVLEALIVVVRDTHEDADVRAIFKIQDQAGVLDGFPRGF